MPAAPPTAAGTLTDLKCGVRETEVELTSPRMPVHLRKFYTHEYLLDFKNRNSCPGGR